MKHLFELRGSTGFTGLSYCLLLAASLVISSGGFCADGGAAAPAVKATSAVTAPGVPVVPTTVGAAAAATADVYKINQDGSPVVFKAVGKPGFLRITGEGAKASGEFKQLNNKFSGSVVIHLDDFNSGIELRDKHMKEKYLETGKYPTAELVVDGLQIDTSKSDEQSFEGTLNLHGKSGKVSGKVKVSGEKAKLLAQAQFELNLADYAIEIPEYLGVTVASKVTVEATLALVK